MALPVSIGDAILLSQIAYNLGNAFSSGRKSAPAEFAEIRDLLFTLSGALKLLARGLPDADSTEGRSISRSDTEQTDEEHALLAQIIVNCRSTLSHLQALVEKYTALDTKPSQKDEDRRWTDEIRENLKKILWTREGGGVAKLKLTLIAHINGLNLAVGAINKRHGGIVRDQVEAMRSKLDSIYTWFQQNLEDRCTPKITRQHKPLSDGGSRLTFSVSIHLSPHPQHLRLHCPRASFQHGWLESTTLSRSDQSILQCHCNRVSGHRGHEDELHATLTLSSILVLVAQSARRKWHMLVATSSLPQRMSHMYISGIAPAQIAVFEEQAARLALYQARGHLGRGRSSGLISIQPYMTGEGIVSILNTKAEIYPEADADDDCRIAFHANDRNFVVKANSIYSILQYRSIHESIVRAVPEGARFSSLMIHQPRAELVFQGRCGHAAFPDQPDNQYYIRFKSDTRIANGENQRFVKLFNVLCVSEQKGANGSTLVHESLCDSVAVEFNDSRGAKGCLESLRAMQRELFTIYLQNPGCGEHIVFQRSVGDITIRGHYIPSAHMAVIMNIPDEQYRIILQSDCQSVTVCMEMSPQILESLAIDPHASARKYPAYFVLIDEDGTEISSQNVLVDELFLHGEGDNLRQLLQGTEANRTGPSSFMLE